MIKVKLIILIAILLILYLLYQAGNYLVITDIPRKSDVIVVLAGDGGRMEYGVQLLKLNYANYIIFSGGKSRANTKSEAAKMEQYALDQGIPKEKIIIEDKADSTFTNGTNSKVIIQENKFNSAIIVTSDYHMRRTRLVFNKLFKNTGVTLTFCASKSNAYNPKRWWMNKTSLNITKTEYIKIIFYGLYYRLWV